MGLADRFQLRAAPYVANLHPRILGLTGTPAQVHAAADAYKAYYARYTGFIYLMGRFGEYLGFFPPGTAADRMVEIISRHLGQHD